MRVLGSQLCSRPGHSRIRRDLYLRHIGFASPGRTVNFDGSVLQSRTVLRASNNRLDA